MEKYFGRLNRYAENVQLPIDNIASEHAICFNMVVRNRWLFSDTQSGVHASALIYSFLQTAKDRGIELYIWLLRVLRGLSAPEHIETLLLWNLSELRGTAA